MTPANVSTGGPEALHQLGDILRNDLKKCQKSSHLPSGCFEVAFNQKGGLAHQMRSLAAKFTMSER